MYKVTSLTKFFPKMPYSPALAILCAGTAVMALFFQWNAANPFVVKNSLFLACASAVWVALLFSLNTIEMDARISFLFALLMSACGLSLLSAKTPVLCIGPLEIMIAGFLVFHAVLNMKREDVVPAYCGTLVFCGIVMALFGIKQYLFPHLLDPGYLAFGKMQIYSTLGNSNYLAIFLLSGITAGIFGLQNSANPVHRRWYGAAIFLQFVCLLITFSRAAYVGLAAGGVILAYGRIKATLRLLFSRRWLVFMTVLFVISVLAVLLFNGGAHKLLDSHSIKGRFFIWAVSREMLFSHPLTGVGLGNFEITYLFYQVKLFASHAYAAYSTNAALISGAHNEFFTILVETGPLGMISFLGVVIVIMLEGFKDAENRVFLAGFTALVAAACFADNLSYAPLAMNFWVLAALLCGKTRKRFFIPVSSRGVSLACAVAVLSVSAGLVVRDMTSNYLERRGDVSTEISHFDEASGYFNRAVALTPYNGYLREKRALAWFFAGKYEDALSELDQAARYSGDIGIQYLQAEILTRRFYLNEAVRLYTFISTAYPNHITPPFMLGQIYMKMNDLDKAEEQFNRVQNIRPSRYNGKLQNNRRLEYQKRMAAVFLKRIAVLRQYQRLMNSFHASSIPVHPGL